MEKLFKKYRPDSKESKKRKNRDDIINKGEVIKENEKEDEWASVNVDDLIDQFMKTKDEFNKKVSKMIQKEKEKEENKEEEKENQNEKEK